VLIAIVREHEGDGWTVRLERPNFRPGRHIIELERSGDGAAISHGASDSQTILTKRNASTSLRCEPSRSSRLVRATASTGFNEDQTTCWLSEPCAAGGDLSFRPPRSCPRVAPSR
jgi:hypothetical protein